MPATKSRKGSPSLVEKVYEELKAALLDFEVLPGDRFTEAQIAQRVNTSRTPVREALFHLEQEGYVESKFRGGWVVKPFDFRKFEELYDLRIILELAAVERLCARRDEAPQLKQMKDDWLIKPLDRSKDGAKVCALDERFHGLIIASTANEEMMNLHKSITERIRIIRRLDFTQPERLTATYLEHAAIIEAISNKSWTVASELLSVHINKSKSEVRNITLHKLDTARTLRYESPS